MESKLQIDTQELNLQIWHLTQLMTLIIFYGEWCVCVCVCMYISGVPRNFVRGFQQIQLRTEDRENGDLGAVVP
jgi:hypothetical protein